MISLTYMSTAATSFDQASLIELLEVSRRNNRAAALSGMLLFADGHFIQTLEGSPASVEAAFERIGADPRHRDVIVVLREDIDERMFDGWSMGFDELSDETVAQMPGFSEFLAAKTDVEQKAAHLGRAGIFHRVFRDNMR